MLSAAASATAQTLFPAIGAPSPKRETRAVWLTTIGGLDWPHTYARNKQTRVRQQRELCEILDKLHRANINTVFFQTRVRATTVYNSSLEPWDGCVSGNPGVSPGYDPLSFAIEECHKRGMELHAWVVTVPVGKWNGHGCAALRRRYPSMVKRIKDEGYMNPESEQTAQYLSKICAEIVSGYDVDGIHLDYIRYPETWNITCGKSQARKNITRIVEAVHDVVKSRKPWVTLSCSPIGKHADLTRYSSYGWNARDKVCQDAQSWLRDGLMDALFPMMYFRGDQFYPFALDWAEQSNGRTVAPGLGIYFLHPREKDWPLETITREMEVTRSLGMGQAFFRSKFLTDNVKGLYSFMLGGFYAHPALTSQMAQGHTSHPTPPTCLNKEADDKVVTLSWNEAANHSGAPYILYNVYASKSYPVNTEDARNLIAARLQTTTLTVESVAGMHFAVTAYDRYGNESAPLQQADDTPATNGRQLYVTNEGHRLHLPATARLADADLLLFESLSGNVVSSRLYAPQVDISTLPDGIYTLLTVNRKGIRHRLGNAVIRH